MLYAVGERSLFHVVDATSPARPRTRYYASRHLHRGRGAGCRNFSRLPARGGTFSLDILFYRTKSASLAREAEKSSPQPASARRAGQAAQPWPPPKRVFFRKILAIWGARACPPL